MFRRLMYHGFWNFYDNMGLLVLGGAAYALVQFGGVFGLLHASAIMPPGAVYGAILLFTVLLAGIAAAGLFGYCRQAARGESPRFKQLLAGVRRHVGSCSKLIALWATVTGVLATNLWFYFGVYGAASQGWMRMVLTTLIAVIGWAAAVWFVILPAWLSAGTASEETSRVWGSLKRALISVTLAPGCWIGLAVGLGALIVAGTYVPVLFIFVMPMAASLGQTTYWLSEQFVVFLQESRTVLGGDSAPREYKRKAHELAWEWEYRQPRRTFKELIKPWEY